MSEIATRLVLRMCDSDQDDFQRQKDPAKLQRLLQRKQKKTPAATHIKRRLSCTPRSAPPRKYPYLQSDKALPGSSGYQQHGIHSSPQCTSADLTIQPSTRPGEVATSAPYGLHDTGAAPVAQGGNGQEARQQDSTVENNMQGTADSAASDPPASVSGGLQETNQTQKIQHPSVGRISAATQANSKQQVAQHLCPVCGTSFSTITTTEAGRAAHVNACLDSAATVVHAGVQSPTAAAAPDVEEQQIEVVEVEDDLADWLTTIGAAAVLDQFIAADLDISVLPHLNDHDLQEMGIGDVCLRQKILAAAASQQAGLIGAEHPPSAALGLYARSQQQHQHPARSEVHIEEASDIHEDGLGWDDCGDDDWEDGHGCQYENMQVPEGWNLRPGCPAAAAAVSPTKQAAPVVDMHSPQQHMIYQQQEQRQQYLRLPLQPIQQAAIAGVEQQQRIDSGASGQGSSIMGISQQHQQNGAPRQHQQHAKDHNSSIAKQQWQALFSKPGRVLAPPQPVQQRQDSPQQRQLGQQGQVLPGSSRHGSALQSSAGQQQQQQQQQQQAMPPGQPGQCSIISRSQTADLPRWWPAWRRLPGTNIVVDCFGQSSKSIGANRTWILTHFHADHYMGLSKGFKQGKILCTRITAALVKLKLRVPEQLLVPLDLGQEVMVEGTRVQFIDANHCPGAALVVAYPPGGLPPVLHTGDARLTASATQQQPALQALVGRAILVLDTTYANPTYCFPPQQEVLDWVLRAVKAESFNPRTLFLFGSYTIGKERLFLHVAAALKAKIYVAAAKRAVLGAIKLPPEHAALLTTNHLEANIHVVPMRQVNLSEMESLLVRYKGRYTAVVGFQPTGWAQGGGGGGGRSGEPSRSNSTVRPSKRLQRGTVVLYKVPYSEHSSCAELRDFVSWFKPLQIIPSVSNDNGPKLKQMLAAVRSSGRTTGPLDGWAHRQ